LGKGWDLPVNEGKCIFDTAASVVPQKVWVSFLKVHFIMEPGTILSNSSCTCCIEVHRCVLHCEWVLRWCMIFLKQCVVWLCYIELPVLTHLSTNYQKNQVSISPESVVSSPNPKAFLRVYILSMAKYCQYSILKF
jgi:hypothetical protein